MDLDRVNTFSTCILLGIFLLNVSAEAEISSPEQIHISFGNSDTSMVVMWSSRDKMEWELHYGTLPFLMQMAANCSTATLPESHFKAAKYIYRAELRNLSLDTKYFYRIVSTDEATVKSETFSFNTLSYTGDSDGVWRFVVYGDMGTRMSGPTRAAIDTLRKQREITAILHVGDFAYDLNTDGGKVGDDFMKEIEHLAAEIPYMTTPGNHEIAENFSPYRTRFSTPNTAWPIPINKMWYSFDVGPVHFISYSTEVYFTYDEKFVCEQFDWLTRDLVLANQNREKTPWIIAFGHRPMYCSNDDGDDCTDAIFRRWVKTGLESLFYAQGVDLIIQAHEHSYERLYPMFNGKVERFNYTNPRAPVHVISGAAGSEEGLDPWSDSSKTWSAFRSNKMDFQSFGVLEVYNRTHLYFSQHDTRYNNTADTFWLIQQQHGPFIKNINCSHSKGHDSCICHLPLVQLKITIALLSTIAGVFVTAGVVLLLLFIRRRRLTVSARRMCKLRCVDSLRNKHSTNSAMELLLDDHDT